MAGGGWTPAAPVRAGARLDYAYRLSWISTVVMGICLLLSLWVAYSTLSAPLPEGKPNYYPKAQQSMVWYNFQDAATSHIDKAYVITLGVLADNLAAAG